MRAHLVVAEGSMQHFDNTTTLARAGITLLKAPNGKPARARLSAVAFIEVGPKDSGTVSFGVRLAGPDGEPLHEIKSEAVDAGHQKGLLTLVAVFELELAERGSYQFEVFSGEGVLDRWGLEVADQSTGAAK